jgi:hypothetical protein
MQSTTTYKSTRKMKTIITALLVFITTIAFSQSDKYLSAMKKNLALFDSTMSTEQSQALSASFERIGDAEKTEWLPYYYSALALLTPGWSDPNIDKDVNAQKVKAICDKAEPLAKSNEDKSEIMTLRNMIATQQMLVDPQNRWMTYGQEAGNYLKQAKELNPNNPRVAYLEGASVFGTPEQFGGGKSKAKPVLEKAVALYTSEQPKPMYPNWGKDQAQSMLAQCQ